MTTTDTCTDSPSTKATASVMLADLPPIGQPLAGGAFAGLITTKAGIHCAVVLLDDKPQLRLAWHEAKAWAQGIGGELPTRPVASMLYANLKPQLQAKWHWTSDELQDDTGDADDASYAWHCHFNDGIQGTIHKSAEGAAVAVRLIPLSA